MEMLADLAPLLKTFWYIALPCSVIFAIQSILTFVGADATDGIEADFDADFDGSDAPFQLFSLRNLINFLLGFSWTGISLYNSIENHNILIAVSALVGLLFVALFFIIIKQIRKLAEDNTFKLSDTLNRSADVYLSIPARKTGKGKISISIGGSHKELDAVTEHESISTGAVVKIIGIINKDLLLVEKL